MSEPSREEVEAAKTAFHTAYDAAFESGSGLPNDWTVDGLRAALEAAAKVRQKGERVVWSNQSTHAQIVVLKYEGVVEPDQVLVMPQSGIVIRPIGGKEQKSE